MGAQVLISLLYTTLRLFTIYNDLKKIRHSLCIMLKTYCYQTQRSDHAQARQPQSKPRV